MALPVAMAHQKRARIGKHAPWGILMPGLLDRDNIQSQLGPHRAPFPWFGGKSRVASLIWERFGDVPNYVEPFFGSGAVLLGRPHKPAVETVNDLDGYLCNFWRAVQADPVAVARWADYPANECDLHARHVWLVERKRDFVARLEGDPEFFDAKVAGWWVWGLGLWIGGGWCSGNGPWQSIESADGSRQLIAAGDVGRGVRRQRIQLASNHSVRRQRIQLSNVGSGVQSNGQDFTAWIVALSERLKHVRVCCGDWSRVSGACPTTVHGLTGVFLDPPYPAEAGRYPSVYAEEDLSVAHKAAAWAIEQSDNPLMRIAFCGYDGSHQFPGSWPCVAWKNQGGYANLGSGNGILNCVRERVWFSPHCLRSLQAELF